MGNLTRFTVGLELLKKIKNKWLMLCRSGMLACVNVESVNKGDFADYILKRKMQLIDKYLATYKWF